MAGKRTVRRMPATSRAKAVPKRVIRPINLAKKKKVLAEVERIKAKYRALVGGKLEVENKVAYFVALVADFSRCHDRLQAILEKEIRETSAKIRELSEIAKTKAQKAKLAEFRAELAECREMLRDIKRKFETKSLKQLLGE